MKDKLPDVIILCLLCFNRPYCRLTKSASQNINILIFHLLFGSWTQVRLDKAVINIPVDHLIDYLAQRSRGP